MQDVRDDLRNSIAKDAVTIENESLTVPGACKNIVEVPDIQAAQNTDELSLDFQKKITLYENVRLPATTKSECFLSGMFSHAGSVPQNMK